MPISLNGDGIISGVSTLTNPSQITVGTGASIFSPATNELALGTNNTEKVRIDSSGNFNLVNTAGIMTAFKYETPALINNHFKSQSTTAGAYVRMYASAGTGQWDIYGNGANLRFSDNASSGNIQMDRPLSMNSQNIIMSSGYGIDFSATSDGSGTMSSELLDDYEEGSFTPSWGDSSSAYSSPAPTYNNRYGNYTKIGNIVLYDIQLETTAWNGAGGTLWAYGLPFTTRSSGYQQGGGGIFCVSGVDGANAISNLTTQIAPGTTRIELYYSTASTGGNFNAFGTNDINEAGSVSIRINGYYFTD